MSYMKTLAAAARAAGRDVLVAALAPLRQSGKSNEVGRRITAEEGMRRLYSQFAMANDVREQIMVIRDMEVRDGRVKRIHNKVARDMVRGGLVMLFRESASSESLKREWRDFSQRLELHRMGKLTSDAHGLVAEGNLPLQLVLDDAQRVAAAVRMPAETIVPLTTEAGRFADATRAYEQRNTMTGGTLATFAAWQLQMARLDPLNYDDMGSMGRPMLDASVQTWRKLCMTEEDLVIRRRQRAPLRLSHVLEGASIDEVDAYRKMVEGENGDISKDFYANRKGGVTALQGDANLGEVNDVIHLLDTFFAGSPLPKELVGYTGKTARDVLEDIKRDYFDVVDHLQDATAGEYEQIFRIHMLLQGVVVGADEIELRYSQRRTETPNQVADLALKLSALGFPPPVVWEEMGYDRAEMLAEVEEWKKQADPYPALNAPPRPGAPGSGPSGGRGEVTSVPAGPNVSVTPSNARKGESASYTQVPGTNHGRGRQG